jgi:hypothetical protein
MIQPIAARLIRWLTPLAYAKLTLDKVNQKLIEPVVDLPGYWRFVNPADMPEARFVHYLHYVKQLAMNVDEDLLLKYLAGFKDAFEKGDKAKFYAYEFMLKDTLQHVTPVETYYWMAALLYFDEVEDVSCFDHDYNQRKIQHFKTLPNQTFFLSVLIKHLKKSGEELLSDIQDSLKLSLLKAEKYERILSGKTTASS